MIDAIGPSGAQVPTSQLNLFNFQGKEASNKIHERIILGGLLFALGAAFVAALIFLSPLPAVTILIGATLGLSICLAPLISSPQKTTPKALSTPFIPGQPIGIQQQGQNCWLNSSLQLICNVPAYQNRLNTAPKTSFYTCLQVASQQYQADRNKKEALSLDTQVLRTSLKASNKNPNFDASIEEPADPWDLLYEFLKGLKMHEELIMPNTVSDLQAHYNTWSPAPDRTEFTVKIERGDAQGPLNHKLQNALHLKTRVGNFNCDGFTVHQGETVYSRHYIAYIYKVGHWWEINDSLVRKLTKKEAAAYAEDASVLHYQKIFPST